MNHSLRPATMRGNMDFEDETRAIEKKLFASLTARKGESRSACFVVIAGKQTGALYKLEKGEVLIGRGKEASTGRNKVVGQTEKKMPKVR